MTENTTNINELLENITMETNEVINQNNTNYNPNDVNNNVNNNVNNDINNNVNGNTQNEMNKFITGLQEANVSGITSIPQRDVPTNTSHITQDETIVPNYIPEEKENNFTKTDLNLINEQLDTRYKKMQSNDKIFDNIIEEIQLPILISLLFFIFQLPTTKTFLYNNFPSFYFNDGNYNIKGLILISSIFGTLYYLLNKIINIIN